MMLFNDTELFVTGCRVTKAFDLPDADVLLIDKFFNKEEADHYYDKLLSETTWHVYKLQIDGKNVTDMKSGNQKKEKGIQSGNAHKFTADLNKIRQRVEIQTHLKFNAVLLNLYRNGNDGVSWHSDKINRSGSNPIIASVTFGETRMFRLRHKFRKEVPQIDIPLYHGSFLIMAGTTNSFWEHAVSKTTKDVLPRINLTFRRVIR